jgi:hypothetical protein
MTGKKIQYTAVPTREGVHLEFAEVGAKTPILSIDLPHREARSFAAGMLMSSLQAEDLAEGKTLAPVGPKGI